MKLLDFKVLNSLERGLQLTTQPNIFFQSNLKLVVDWQCQLRIINQTILLPIITTQYYS